MNNLIDDPCAQQQDWKESKKKLKYTVTNHRDLLDAKQNANFFGMAIKDELFVPADKMDDDSKMRYAKMTNPNVRYELEPFPVNTGFRGNLYRGNVDKEMRLRGMWDRELKSCQPKGHDYFQRHFFVFPEGVETPDAKKSVETWRRGGICTRCGNHMQDSKLPKK